MNSCVDSAIVTLYEVEGMKVEEISELEGIDEILVRGILTRGSDKFRAEEKGESSALKDTDIRNLISRDTLENVARAYADLAVGAENEAVREKAGKWVLEEFNGRNERKVKAIERSNGSNFGGGLRIGAIVLNQHLERAKEAKKRAGIETPTLELVEAN